MLPPKTLWVEAKSIQAVADEINRIAEWFLVDRDEREKIPSEQALHLKNNGGFINCLIVTEMTLEDDKLTILSLNGGKSVGYIPKDISYDNCMSYQKEQPA